MPEERGERRNTGKLRYDLINPHANDGLVRVLTKGAEKYAPRNWEKGMPWSEVIASLKRHLAAIERGEDYDPETGELHADHMQCNTHFLSAYYHIAPQFDDRVKRPQWRIGLDIDEVLAGWCDSYRAKYNIPEEHVFNSWYLHYDVLSRCETELKDDFYSDLCPIIKPEEIPFEPHCYITSRNVSEDTTKEWLYKHGYPTRPVYTVGLVESKADIAKREKLDIFIDDVYKNFVELNNAGVCCYLLDRPHNRRFDVGFKRIYNLLQFK